jgi:hypothetical protein
MQTLTLHDLTDELLALDALVAMDDGEWTDAHEALAIEHTEQAMAKVDSFAGYLRDRKTRIAVIDAEIERLTERAQYFAKEVERLERYALFCLERSGRDKMAGTLHTMAARKNPPKLVVEDESQILALPEAVSQGWVRVIPPVPEQRKLDANAVKKALAAGTELPGVSVTQTVRLEIK